MINRITSDMWPYVKNILQKFDVFGEVPGLALRQIRLGARAEKNWTKADS